MPCYSPIQAWPGPVNSNGKRPLVFRRPRVLALMDREIPVPCNTCIGCQLDRARQWAMRCMDEAFVWPVNSFITLTYDRDHLPLDGALSKDVWVSFMKRLRLASPEKIRFFMCGEYGPKHGRPHYHALVFNLGFADKVLQCISPSGEKVFRSDSLTKIWGLGYASVGDVTFGSAAYVARYALKKMDGVPSDVSRDHYLDPRTGELRPPEFRLMSRMPGIGRSFYEKFKLDMFPGDFRIISGMKSTPARYYGSLYEKENPSDFARIKLARVKRASGLVDVVASNGHVTRVSDNDSYRLAVKQEVKVAQLRSLSRSLED